MFEIFMGVFFDWCCTFFDQIIFFVAALVLAITIRIHQIPVKSIHANLLFFGQLVLYNRYGRLALYNRYGHKACGHTILD